MKGIWLDGMGSRPQQTKYTGLAELKTWWAEVKGSGVEQHRQGFGVAGLEWVGLKAKVGEVRVVS